VSASEEEIRGRLVAYLLDHGDGLEFTKYFWKACEPLPRDVNFYSMFTRVICDLKHGHHLPKSSRQVGVGFGSLDSWARLASMPKLAHYLKAFLELGPPSTDHTWLNTDCTHGQALPVGQFVEVPLEIKAWDDIERVLSQLRPITPVELQQTPIYALGFFFGIMIGDASKKKQGRGHGHVALVLSKKYETNMKIGDYTTSCAHRIGLRMHRQRDIEAGSNKPFGFYQWTSQSSPLVDWFFEVALGLKEHELTTYDPIRAEWVFDAPLEFRLGLIHGIAESDGSVSVASQEVEFWIGPNWKWMIRLLQTFNLRGFVNREAVTLSKSQAIAAFSIPVFASHLRTVRFQRLELMATSRRLDRKERLSEETRLRIMELARPGVSVPKIVELIAMTMGILISFEAAQRWAMKTGMYHPKNSRESADRDAQVS
jgi:hypothetical protein